MFGTRNVYSDVVCALEAAYDACASATQEAAEVPTGKGGDDIAHLAGLARNYLYEALHIARQWQESYDYHVKGGHGHRTDF